MAVLKRLKFAAQSEALQRRAEAACSKRRSTPTWQAVAARDRGAAAASQADAGDEAATQAPAAAGAPAAPRGPPRAREHHLRLRLPDEAHRRGRGREAGLPPGVFTVERHVRGKWVCAQLRDAGPGAGAAARHRQGHAHRRAAGPGAGGQVRWITCRCTGRKRSSSAPAWRSRARRWRSGSASAACSCSRWSMRCSAELLRARGAARRRDAGGDAQAGQRQDAPGVPVELLHDAASTRCKAVVFDFAESRGGQHVREFLASPDDTPGAASWCATTSAATRPASSSA